ncbi:MAG: Serine/threonine-protein kinase pkn1 [Chloroflexi bacterium ADurb.Bin360]|nr:MAG: Serine/threonine-protein kinase pkn1 [Chloroflexi bacterium ADurb.Bin360]
MPMVNMEGRGRVIIASSREDEQSFAGKPYSVFTLALIEALAGVGVAKKDGFVRVADLALHAREVVPGRTKGKQHPILHFEHADNYVIAYYAGGDVQPKGLPFATEAVEIEPEPGAWQSQVGGSGAQALGDHATALGKGAARIGGSVGGDVVTGKKASIGSKIKINIENLNLGPAPSNQSTVRAEESGREGVNQNKARGTPDEPTDPIKKGFDDPNTIKGDPIPPQPTCDPAKALACYLTHVIEKNSHLQLQGIRSASGLVSIALEEVYITLTATVRKTVTDEETWVEEMARLASGEAKRQGLERPRESVQQVKVQVQEALALHSRLVVLGDPGCGKTTLLRYLALTFARDFADDRRPPTADRVWIKERLGLDERRLPVLLPLRDFARYLEQECPNVGADGPKLLLDYLRLYFTNQNLELPPDFFEARLKTGKCAVFFDGMDEVASMSTRQRIARILERFTSAYPDNRYVVTSRIGGYTGGAQLEASYAVTTVCDFTDEDIARFAQHWNRAVEIVLAGAETDYALRKAKVEAAKLTKAIQVNARVRELAVNPLLLTVIALVQRENVVLPNRRAEFYEEAIEVLLMQWDAGKGLPGITALQGLELDAGDWRSFLEPVALWLMEQRLQEIELYDLRRQLAPPFHAMLKDWQLTTKAVDGFIALINACSGLLTERGQGIYAFSHLAFQKYLAARAVAGKAGNVAYVLERLGDSWWREVILLEAGHLGTQGKRRAMELIRAVVEHPREPEPYHNLVLAAEALREVGQARTEGDLVGEIQERLRQAFAKPLNRGNDLTTQVQRRAAAAEALDKIESGAYGAQPAFWALPYGEPVWVEIPAGEFWMGSGKITDDAKSIHKVYLEYYWMAKTPITNAQYWLFVEATGREAPKYWENGRIPRGLESHPVVNVTWHDALAYCRWLSEVTGKAITLPSEAEWEKAARGDKDEREYPWGMEWEEGHCNSSELGVNCSTPIGVFPEGASPYGCLDLVGNVWEWTRSHWRDCQSSPLDGVEDLAAGDDIPRMLRGGAFDRDRLEARCAYHYWNYPYLRYRTVGFRVCVVSRQE